MVRAAFGVAIAVVVGTASAACTSAQAPQMRKAAMVAALGGVAGIVGSAFARNLTDKADEMMIGCEVISAVGVASFAYAEITWPRVEYREEPLPERHRRWAKILTERASGAAREGRCARVRRLEVRVQRYDREIHDFVLMKDPEIVKCLEAPASAGEPAATPEPPAPAGEPADAPAGEPADAPAESPLESSPGS